MKRYSPEKGMDEIILNPKSLQNSHLNLRHSSQVISVGGGHNVFAFLICSGLCTRSSRMNYPSDSLLWIFCSLASKQKVIQSELLQSASAENQYLIKARSKDKVKKKKKIPPSWGFPLSFLFYINNTVFSCLSLFCLPTDILPLWFTLCVL